MSLARKLIQGSAVNLVDHTVKIAVMFVTTPLMVSCLGPENYGIWIVALTIVGYLRLLDLGVSLAGSHFLAHAIGSGAPERYQEQFTVLSYLFNRIAFVSLLSTLLLVVVLPHWLPSGSVLLEARWILLGLGISTSVRFWTQISVVVLKSHLRYDWIGLTSIIKTVLQGTLVLLVLLNGHGLRALILVFVATDALDQALLVSLSRRIYPEGGLRLVRKRPPGLGAIVRYGATTTAAIVGSHLRGGVAPVVIAHFSGLAAVPVYSIGTRFTSLFADIINSVFGGNFLAAFSQLEGREDPEALVRGFFTSLRFSTALATFAGCGLALFGPAFIERWIGPSFSKSGLTLLILVGPTTLMLMQYPANNLFLSRNKQHWLAFIALGGGIFTATLGIALTFYFGFFGMVWAACIEMVVSFGFVVPVLASRICGVSVFLYLWKTTKHSLPVLLTATAFHFFTKNLLKPDYPTILILAGAFTLIVAPVLWYSAFLPNERKTVLKSAGKLLPNRFSPSAISPPNDENNS